jgi:fibrillarin-like pre-rRNA processing protein
MKIPGVFRDKNKIFTENPGCCRGNRVYNEKLVKHKGRELRSWNPYRSKLAAAMLKGLELDICEDSRVLYLGAATGTTVSHISDIAKDGVVYAVENSPLAVNGLLKVSEKRENIVPVLGDANHPDRYFSIVSGVDLVYQDISQRNQSEIFVINVERYLKDEGVGVLMVKARSIDVSLKPREAFDLVCSELESSGLKVESMFDLQPFEKDHAVVVISK